MFVSNQQLNMFVWDNIHKISYECFYILLEILSTYPKQAVANRHGENNVNSQFLTIPIMMPLDFSEFKTWYLCRLKYSNGKPWPPKRNTTRDTLQPRDTAFDQPMTIIWLLDFNFFSSTHFSQLRAALSYLMGWHGYNSEHRLGQPNDRSSPSLAALTRPILRQLGCIFKHLFP